MIEKYGKINNFETGEIQKEEISTPLIYTYNRKEFD